MQKETRAERDKAAAQRRRKRPRASSALAVKTSPFRPGSAADEAFQDMLDLESMESVEGRR